MANIRLSDFGSEFAVIALSAGKSAIVDRRDFEWLSQWKWHFHPTKQGSNRGYAAAWDGYLPSGRQKRIFMHRQIMARYGKVIDGFQVDHINQNSLDNTRNNLRVATFAENRRNISANRVSKSGVLGVCWKAKGQKWVVQIHKNGKVHHVGYFKELEDAVNARRQAEIECYGSFAPSLSKKI